MYWRYYAKGVTQITNSSFIGSHEYRQIITKRGPTAIYPSILTETPKAPYQMKVLDQVTIRRWEADKFSDTSSRVTKQYYPSKNRNSSLGIMTYAINPYQVIIRHLSTKISSNTIPDRDKDMITSLYPRKGEDPNVLDDRGGFPLYWACSEGHYDQAAGLLKQGADPKLRSGHNWTALHSAVENGFIDIVRLLLDSGAIVDVESDSKATPLNLARDSRMRKLLQEYANDQRRRKETRDHRTDFFDKAG